MSLTYLEWNCPMCGKKNRVVLCQDLIQVKMRNFPH